METEEKDDFASAFAEAIEADTKSAEPEDKLTTAASEIAATEEAPAEKEDGPASTAETKEVAEPTKEREPTPVESKTEPTPIEKPEHVAARREEVRERTPAPAPAARAEEAQPEFVDPVLTEDQKKQLDNFRKEWPDIAAAQETQLQHVTTQLEMKFARALTTLIEHVYGDITPMATMYAGVAQDDHRSAIVGKHGDFDEVAPKLKPWIDSQPGYLRKSFNDVYDNGTAEEIIDLVQRFKEANGVRPQVNDTTPAQPKVSSKKVEALAPVGGKRSVVGTRGSDPNDYKGAFTEALDSL